MKTMFILVGVVLGWYGFDIAIGSNPAESFHFVLGTYSVVIGTIFLVLGAAGWVEELLSGRRRAIRRQATFK